jgi:hypothetical protein
MTDRDARPMTIEVAGAGSVSGLLLQPPGATALFVLAHGAGAGMRHPFLETVARHLAERGVATLRYQFPYMEARRHRTDPPDVAEATVRAAVKAACEVAPGLALVAGGKSFGGRMTTQAEARGGLPDVRGLILLGFPLHPPGRPGGARGEHLRQVGLPMLFVQGTRDALAELERMRALCADLGALATLHVIDGGDHSFALPKSSGRPPEVVLGDVADVIAAWTAGLTPSSGPAGPPPGGAPPPRPRA